MQERGGSLVGDWICPVTCLLRNSNKHPLNINGVLVYCRIHNGDEVIEMNGR